MYAPHRYAHGVGGHLRVNRVAALAYLRLAGLHLHGAVLVEHHAAGGALQRDGPHTGVVPIERHAHAAADIARLRLCVLRIEPLEVRGPGPRLHALAEAVAPVDVLGKAVLVALRHGYFAPELDRAHAERLCHVVYVRLAREGGLGYAVAAHRARGREIGEYSPGVALEVLAGVDLREGVHALGADAVPVRGVAALIRPALELAGGKAAVRPYPGNNVAAYGMADAVAGEGFLPAAFYSDRPAAQLCSQPGAERLIERVLLVAEAAAYVGLYYPHLAPGYAQRLTHDAAHDVRYLR